MYKLTNYENDIYSQFGEDGIISQIFMEIGTSSPPTCVEFGAGDGVTCSNTAMLWRNNGWEATLIESNEGEYAKLCDNAKSLNVLPLLRHVRSKGEDSLDVLAPGEHDLVVIDVDGDDYWIWKYMESRHRVVCIEFNPTVPPHLSLYQTEGASESMGFGASLAAFDGLALEKGYKFVGATYCNAFFVRDDLAAPFLDYDCNRYSFSTSKDYSYLITDFLGNAVAVGRSLPWGTRIPYAGPRIEGDVVETLEPTRHTMINYITGSEQAIMDDYEERCGNILRWVNGTWVNGPQKNWPNIANPEVSGAREVLKSFLSDPNYPFPICIALSHVSNRRDVRWIQYVAKEHNWSCHREGSVLVLLRRPST